MTGDVCRRLEGIIENENYAYIDNVKTSRLSNSELFSAPYKFNIPIQFIYNVGYCDIYNSNVGASYNNKNMTIINTYIERFVSNKDYSNQTSYTYFDNSNIHRLTVNDCELLIFNNSYINCYFNSSALKHEIVNSSIIWENVTLSKYNGFLHYFLEVEKSNLSATSSYILTPVLGFVFSSFSIILST